MKLNVRNMLTAIFLIVGIIAAYFTIKNYGFSKVISFFSNFSLGYLLLYILAVFLIFTVLTLRWNTIIRANGYHVPFHKLYIYRLIGFSINFFTPGPRVGGEPTQARLLEDHGMKYNNALSTVMIDKILDSTTSGILFILGISLIGLHYTLPEDTAIAFTIFGALFLLIVGSFYYRMLKNKHFFLKVFHFLRVHTFKWKWAKNMVKDTEEVEKLMMKFYKKNSRAFMMSVGVSILSWIVMFFEYKMATTLLGLDVGVIEIFFIISFVGLSILMPIPMSIGALEAGQVSAFKILRLSGSAGVALAFLVRMKDFFAGLIGLALLTIYGFDVGKTLEKKYKK